MRKTNRFSAGITETLIGPAPGAIGDLLELAQKARDAVLSPEEEARLADFMNWGLFNTPMINLFYTRPALDYLFLNSMREVASPGFKKRSLRKAKERMRNRDTIFWNRDKKDGGIW